MQKINLLDCTLRDGGYINDWNFGEKAITDIAEKLTDSGVDILELGFLKDEPYITDRTVFNSMEQVKKIIGKKRPGLLYAVMAEVVNPIPLDMIDPADSDSADIIRVIVWKTKHLKDGTEVDALEEGFAYCKGIVEKGYKLCVQPARVDQYSDAEFVRMVQMFQQLNPLAIYVVDSWGTQNAEELLHYMHLADDTMKPGICLGYHGHNNMMQALSAAQAMLKEGFDRKLIIDASVYGIGRGAGNLNSEIIAKYMNEHYGKRYNVMPMLEVYDRYVKAIYAQEQWGYSIPYFLTAKYNCNPNYARYYAGKQLRNDYIESCLYKLSSEEKVMFSEKAARRAQNRVKPKLAVIIPTANRYKAIDSWLYGAAYGLRQYNVDIIIYDSSDDDKTEIVTKNFQIDLYENVFYYRYTGEYDGFSLDNKVISAYHKFAKQYDYLWVIRDGWIVNAETLYRNIFPKLEKHPDFLMVNTPWRTTNDLGDKKYNDPVAWFKDWCVQMVMLGTVIVKSEVITAIIDTIPLADHKNYSLYQPIAFFEYFANKKVNVSCLIDEVFIVNANVPPARHWYVETVNQWCTYWYENIMNLPSCYNKVKAEVLKIRLIDLEPFTPMNLLKLRTTGGLSYTKVAKNANCLSAICDTPLYVIRIIARLPKCVALYLVSHIDRTLGKMIRSVYRIIRGAVPGEKEFEG